MVDLETIVWGLAGITIISTAGIILRETVRDYKFHKKIEKYSKIDDPTGTGRYEKKD